MLSPNEKALLLALKKGRHFKANPAKPTDLVELEAQAANPAGRHLVQLGLAARVPDSERPGAILLRITDAGISEADKIQDADRKPTFIERVKQIPIGKGIWDLIKIGLGFVLGVLSHNITGS